MHGGDNGEVPSKMSQIDSQEDPKYIFEMTYDEIQKNHLETKYYLESP